MTEQDAIVAKESYVVDRLRAKLVEAESTLRASNAAIEYFSGERDDIARQRDSLLESNAELQVTVEQLQAMLRERSEDVKRLRATIERLELDRDVADAFSGDGDELLRLQCQRNDYKEKAERLQSELDECQKDCAALLEELEDEDA